jgi:rod shape determining protein RodA
LIRKINILHSTDWITVIIYIVLVIMGWLNIYAAVYSESHNEIFDFSQSYGKQLMWIGAAFLIAIIIMLIEINFYLFFSYFIYIITILLLIIVMIFGKDVNGSRSWFQIGEFRLQPAEFAKFATCLVMAKYASSFNFNIQNIKKIFMIFLILFLPLALIVLQNDTGSAIVYIIFIIPLYREGLASKLVFLLPLSIALFFCALLFNNQQITITLISLFFLLFFFLNRNIKYFGAGLLIFLICFSISELITYFFKLKTGLPVLLLISTGISGMIYFFLSYIFRIRYFAMLFLFLAGSIAFTFSVNYIFNNVLEHHQKHRINDVLGIEFDPLGAGYNVNQSKIAIGSGGFLGKGYLQGTQTKYNFVPEQSTDFIFCTVGEEWGFVGNLIVLSLFLGLIFRLIYLSERQRSVFSRIYGYGVASIIFFHVMVNVGMTIGLMPVIGIPLPFFSYGGSSLWAFTILLFVFVRFDASRLELLK